MTTTTYEENADQLHATQEALPSSADTHAQAEETEHAAGEAHAGPHISIKAEPVFHVSGYPITNAVLTAFVVVVALTFAFVKYYMDSRKEKKSDYFHAVTALVRPIYSLFESVLGEHTKTFFPLVGGFFFFILFNNWMGLLPGVGSVLLGKTPLLRASTADLNGTVSLALVIMVCVQIFGVKYVGLKGYLGKFFNFSSPIAFFVGILEIVSEISRVLSFSFRLFGNIFAGEVLLTVVAFLVPFAVSFPFLMLETFVGFIQAVVFSILSSVLIKLAITKHH